MRPKRELGQSSDIAFLLIICFLLLSGVSLSRSFEMDTDQGSVYVGETGEHLTLHLTKEGLLMFENRSLSGSALAVFLNQEPSLTLAIEQQTQWQTVVTTLALIERFALTSLSLEVVP